MSNPWEDFQQQSEAKPWDQFQSKESKPKEKSTWDHVTSGVRNQIDEGVRGAGNLIAGGVRGAGSIGATLLSPIDYAARKLNNGQPVNVGGIDIVGQDRRTAMDEGLRSMGADTDSLLFKGGKLGGEVAGTAGAGGALANVLGRTGIISAPMLKSIASSGFSAGGRSGLAGAGTRIAGGGINGIVSGGAVDPSDALISGAFGAALPPVIVGAAGLGRGTANLVMPSTSKLSQYIAEVAGANTPEKLRQFAQGINQSGASLIPGLRETIPQMVQTPEMSQLNRTMRNLSPKLAEVDRLNDTARKLALDRISSVSGTVNQSAENAGNAISAFGNSERARLTKEISNKFEGVDPFNESKFYLPLDELVAAKQKFMGDGHFGSAKGVNAAIDEALRVGTETVEAIKPASTKGLQDLVLAVRGAGGINTSSKTGLQLAGEIKNLRESGLNNLVKPNTGKSIERMAETMHEQGFIPDADPATLLEHLQNSASGSRYYGGNNADNAYRNAMEAAQGEAPAAGTFAKLVPYETVQNYRSALNEAWKDASKNGKNKEAASLGQMISSIDKNIDKVANGQGHPHEMFSGDMVSTWRDAIKSHAEKMSRFESGPQIGMFRNGADGQASIQGAEIPAKFFSSRGSQSADIDSFNRLAGGNQELKDALKNYAITDLANQTEKATGTLTNAKFNNWLNARSGAVGGLFDKSDQAILNAIGGNLKDADLANYLGKSVGSNTAQNGADIIGLLGNGTLNAISKKVPFGTTLLDFAKSRKADKISGLLANPELVSDDILKMLSASGNKGLLSNRQLDALLMGYKMSPAMMATSDR